ncbi:hypothetical protein FIV34_12185 [Luteibacter pinisoli]|uniref:Uncharacterized protein n=1 Tax=Luteibacter pinisoli TaxID=2589080 RepID=A0A4Y5Z417_9GAMM|nr:hypothetical protein [Luteibacter pinisoli]QDE39917.1 hypothetical protein FIV34_12185 [Luteibacter pinisoli]
MTAYVPVRPTPFPPAAVSLWPGESAVERAWIAGELAYVMEPAGVNVGRVPEGNSGHATRFPWVAWSDELHGHADLTSGIYRGDVGGLADYCISQVRRALVMVHYRPLLMSRLQRVSAETLDATLEWLVLLLDHQGLAVPQFLPGHLEINLLDPGTHPPPGFERLTIADCRRGAALLRNPSHWPHGLALVSLIDELAHQESRRRLDNLPTAQGVRQTARL